MPDKINQDSPKPSTAPRTYSKMTARKARKLLQLRDSKKHSRRYIVKTAVKLGWCSETTAKFVLRGGWRSLWDRR
jgi:hypothetical protein